MAPQQQRSVRPKYLFAWCVLFIAIMKGPVHATASATVNLADFTVPIDRTSRVLIIPERTV